MNILYLTNHLNTGGITSYVLSLGSSLKQKGHGIFIASETGELLQNFIDAGINYINIPIRTKSEVSPKILISFLKLLPAVKKYCIDIIHSNSRTTQVLGCLLSRFAPVEHISTCHGFFKKRFSRRLMPCWGEKVIAISQQVKEHLVKDFKVDEKKIFLIHNGIDVEKFKVKNPKSKTDIKKQLGLGNGPVVGIIARLSDVKGHKYLIEAMKIVVEYMPQAQLLIVGEGKIKGGLSDLCGRLSLKKNIFFVDSLRDTRDALSAMDIFVMPSLKEGLGLSLMEAMAFGLPVIGSDVGGIKSLIRNGNNGLMVKPADSEALSVAILELMQNKDKAAMLAEAGRIFIEINFSQEEMVSETQKLYLRCLEG